MLIDEQLTLYRYDLNEPPKDWNSTFLNFEYNYPKRGHKNKANLFFFTNLLETANNLGIRAASEYSRNKYYLTKTSTIIPLKIIDFDNRNNIYQMLCLLNDIGINVLNRSFKTYERNITFASLRKHFEAAEKELDQKKKLNHVTQLKVHSHSTFESIGLFGQRLTDFENGIHFKKLVKSIDNNIDGYRWWEFDKESFSYCLFDSTKLTKKETDIISVI